MRVIGVDSGNAAAGVSFWGDGRFCGSLAYSPWKPSKLDTWDNRPTWETASVDKPVKTHVYVEIPAHGAHASRGGVHWAGGMIVAQIIASYPDCDIVRSRVHKTKPNVWRKKLGLITRNAGKEYYQAKAEERSGGVFETDDEAEAYLIGGYGVLKHGKMESWTR